MVKEFIATVTGRGQITVPAEIRRLLGTRRGDKVAFVIDDEGIIKFTLPHYPDIASVRGAAGSLAKPLSWKEMQQIVREERTVRAYRGEA